jgi:hypothetical protein
MNAYKKMNGYVSFVHFAHNASFFFYQKEKYLSWKEKEEKQAISF